MAATNSPAVVDLEGGGSIDNPSSPTAPPSNQRFVSFQPSLLSSQAASGTSLASASTSYYEANNTPTSAGRLSRHGSLFNSVRPLPPPTHRPP